jgi:hypothetical protein
MNDEIIDEIEPLPRLETLKCKLLALTIGFLLRFFNILVALSVWLFYTPGVALAILLLGFIIVGVIRSKLRNSSLPPHQLEYRYTDSEIAVWYTATHLCF